MTVSDILVTVLFLAAAGFCISMLFRKGGQPLLPAKSPSRADTAPAGATQTSVSVPAGSVVRIRHASDSVEIEIMHPEPVMGPLSDASATPSLLDELHSPDTTPERKVELASALNGQGLGVTVEFAPQDPPESSPEEIEATEERSLAGPLSRGGLDEIRSILIDGLRRRLCTPAFARTVSEVYGFSLEFEDEAMQEESLDGGELEKVRSYRDLIVDDLREAMRRYSGDHPSGAAPEGQEPPAPKAAARPPEYDFSRMG